VKAIADHADLIPGTLEAVRRFRHRGLSIGTTTGYSSAMMEDLLKKSRAKGFTPDNCICADHVPAGRPHPWMALRSAMEMGVYPMEAIVKIGDTVPDIEEGLNAGMWTIALAKSGNETGLSEKEIAALDSQILQARLREAYRRLAHAGAHYVVDDISCCGVILDDINRRLAQGEHPSVAGESCTTAAPDGIMAFQP
jgi:phosphonoacetaldehyde hydrolase